MTGKPGNPDGAPMPEGEDAGATLVRELREQHTQDLLPSVTPSLSSDPHGELPSLRPDELLAGRFSIVRFIARGGMGAVYEASDLSLRTRVALKIIRSPLLADASALERFRREVLLARRVGHPNVCHVYEFYETRTAEGVPVHFLTMELLEGETLARRLREHGRMSTKEALPLVLQMCNGLAAAHAEGVVHRDFKSSNVLLVQRRGAAGDSSTTRAVITDFGIARPLESTGEAGLTGGMGMIGTPEYMAPEQVTGGAVTPSTDVFALGVVMYEMVTGELPFTGDTPLATATKRIDEAPRPPHTVLPGLDRRWSEIILHCLARDPARRFRSPEEVHAALLARPRHPVRRAGLITAGVIAVAAAVVVAAVDARRQARVRLARDEGLPRLAELVELNRYPEALDLAEQLERTIPGDARLEKMFPDMSRVFTVDTTPPGAELQIKPYEAPDSAFRSVGKTPLRSVRVPIGLLRMRLSSPGYERVDLVVATPLAPVTGSVRATLDRAGSLPPGMVRVPKENVEIEIPGLENVPAAQVGDYLIDRTEVTNRQFKAFVDSGGYRNRDLWRQPILLDGHPLAWEAAMARFHDRTGRPGPASWELGDYPEGQGDFPVTGVSWREAAAYAAFVGKDLPTVYEWSRAAGLWGTSQIVPASNFRGAGLVAVGTLGGMGPFGTVDMAGNAKEWCWNESDRTRYILGGAFNEPSYMFNDADAQDPLARGATFGFRLVKRLDGKTAPAAFAPIPLPRRDYTREKPARPEIVQAFKGLYAYDRTPLEARVEDIDETAERWVKEKVSYNAAYGRERILAYLLTPKGRAPPYQLVVLFPGSNAIHERSSKILPGMRLLSPILRSGRAVLYPIYKSTFERGDSLSSDYQAPTAFYRDHVIMWSKDLGRSLDWAETRKDLDARSVAYYGVSWGAQLGPLMLAVNERIRAGILVGGGLGLHDCLPEADPFNFSSQVRQPVLMVNGRYDFFFPVEGTQVPMFRLLGTAPKDKRHVVLEAGHVPPNEVLTQEVLEWLDRYLGPVR